MTTDDRLRFEVWRDQPSRGEWLGSGRVYACPALPRPDRIADCMRRLHRAGLLPVGARFRVWCAEWEASGHLAEPLGGAGPQLLVHENIER